MTDGTTDSHDALLDQVEEQLLDDETLHDEAKYLVLAALRTKDQDDFAAAAERDGAEEIARARATPGKEQGDPVPAARVFLRAVEAEGFRGIGAPARLELHPGPGLTIVAGRNGSGKSSFAEAAEVAVVGGSHRWAQSPRKSWRNVHHADTCRVTLTLTEEGVGDTVAQTEWGPEAKTFKESAFWVQRHGLPRERSRAVLGWDDELSLYKPFLTHSELGDQLEGGPGKLYAAVNSALGLERLDAIIGRLDDLVATWGVTRSQSDAERKAIKALAGGVDDDRARTAVQLLGRTSPDLTAVAALAVGQDDGGRAGLLQRLTELVGPDPAAFDAAVIAFRQTRDRLAETDTAADQQDLARRSLLQAALEHHRNHGPGPCPLCATGTLDDDWASNVDAELAAGTDAVRAAGQARNDHQRSTERLVALRLPVPRVLEQAAQDPLPQVGTVLATWRELADLPDADALAGPERGAYTVAVLHIALDDLRKAAAAEWAKVQDDWRPVAVRLAQWLTLAERAEGMRERYDNAKAAHGWMKEHADEVRNQRLAPINDRYLEIWAQLRQDSNVNLAPLLLRGSKNQRKLVVNAAVDGSVDGPGMDVLSQGELNAVGLAIFLPRVEMVGSPFGFVLIDDPVQAMDPSKVDGLARVLAKLAETRQVVVFTHDDRLPEAVQRLRIAASVLTVVRDRQSVVTVQESSDPVSRYLKDAMAIARDEDIPLDIRLRVVPSLCRSALERRCKELFYRRELRAGATREDVETRWHAARLTKNKVMLVVNRNGETDLDRWRVRPHRVTALRAASRGVHEGWDGDLLDAIRSTRTTVGELADDHG